MNDIAAAFHEYFEIIIADTPALLKEVFSLRFQIWCIKERFFEASCYPDGLEKDEFDCNSIHLLLRHRPSNSFIGTTRLIMCDSSSSNKKFPIESHTQFYSVNADRDMVRKQSVEISRFAILSNFFKRKDDIYFMVGKGTKQPEGNERRRFPHPMLGLAIGIIQICAKHNIYHLYSAMAPALNRLFGFYGMQFDPIGPLVDYYGLRRPYYVCLLDVLERMYINHYDIWGLATDNGRIWPVNLEYFKSICGRWQDGPNTELGIVTY